MMRLQGQHGLLVAGFLAMIGVVGIAQAIIEIREGEPVQALDLFREPPSVPHLRTFEADLERASWFASTLRPMVAYGRFRLFHDTGSKAVPGRDDWWFYRPDLRYVIEPIPQRTASDQGIAAAREAIVDFRDQLAAMGIQLLVIPMPGKPSVYPDRLTHRLNEPLTTGPTQRLIADLTESGVHVVNLFDVFAEAREQSNGGKKSLYLPRDTHWSPTGMKLAAQAAANRIRQMGLTIEDSTDYDVRRVETTRPGDVVRMLQVPLIERLYPPTVVECEQVILRETGERYRDRPDASILILGDSFLRIYERDEPGSAGFIAHLARELSQPLASIVNDGSASTLVRQELIRKRHLLDGKRLVIWEFVERDIRFGLEGWKKVKLIRPREVPTTNTTRPSSGDAE